MDLLKMYFLLKMELSIAMFVYRSVNNSSIETISRMFKYLEKSLGTNIQKLLTVLQTPLASKKSCDPNVHLKSHSIHQFIKSIKTTPTSAQKTDLAPENIWPN